MPASLAAGDYALGPLTRLWLDKIEKAREYKETQFQKTADECLSFYHPPEGNFNFVYKGDINASAGVGQDVQEPHFRMTLCKLFEVVSIFGPLLYFQNPNRQVNPRLPIEIPPTAVPDPMLYMMTQQQEMTRVNLDALKSLLVSAYLNWTPNELGLKEDSDLAIREAIIKGRGCLSGGTLVYARTRDGVGPVRVRDVHRRRDEVFLWDGSRWNRVAKTRQIDRVGNELKIILRGGEEIYCTPDHVWPTERGVVNADGLQVGDILKRVKLPDESPPAPEFIPDEIGWFVGLYLGDGNIDKGRKGRIHLAGHIDEVIGRERVKKIVKQYGGKSRLITLDGTKKGSLDISSPVLVAILREFINGDGAYKKHLSAACWKRSNEFLRHVLEGYLVADGHFIEEEGTWRLRFCQNKDLANSLRILCGRLGYRLVLKLCSEKVGGEEYRLYRGTIRIDPAKCPERLANFEEIVEIGSADWRCDRFYDIALENSPHTYALASGLLTHNCMWTGLITPPGSKTKMVGSFYDSVDFLFVDPDAEEYSKAYWIARKVCTPVWAAERRFGLKKGSLKGAYESANLQVEVDAGRRQIDRQRGGTNDLMVYYEVYSRMGCGGRLSGSGVNRGESDLLPGDLHQYSELLDPIVGDYVYMVVAKGVNFPLNLPPEIQDLPMLGDGSPMDGVKHAKERLAWPVPYWADPQKGAGVLWPCSVLDFHTVPRSAWPQSILKAALGELRFLCWAYSFTCGKIKNTLRDIVAIVKEMAEQFKITVLEGADLSMVELDTNNRDIRECVQILQFPQMNADIWKIVEKVEENFDKRIGLNEIYYGTQKKQDRSATESDIKSQNQNIRPDDMAKKVEAWMTEIARKEGAAARMVLEPNDVLPVLGVLATALWTLHVKTDDLASFHELEYRVEAGSTRKPNRDRDMANADSAMQILMPIFNQFAQGTGQLGPINSLIEYWCKTRDLPPGPFQLPVPPPMAAPAPGEPPGPPGANGAPPGANGAPKARETASVSQGGPNGAPRGTQ